jgi:hypothetical protein
MGSFAEPEESSVMGREHLAAHAQQNLACISFSAIPLFMLK